ncbi:MAG: patatin-like phospholipase family protein [Propylenella sp.]
MSHWIDSVAERRAGARSKQFLEDVLPKEIKTINDRIDATNKSREGRPKQHIDAQHDVIEAVGLALSGGGVRSAAFSLGVLQALNQHDVIKNIDYLSTVSGGGYMGSSLSATLTKTGGKFVFGGRPKRGEPTASDIADTESVEHIRNYSNYLIPRGFRDIMTSLAIVVRGLTANLGVVLPVILIAAALTVYSNPKRSSLLTPDLFGAGENSFLPAQQFGVTLALSLVAIPLFFLWALVRSFLKVNWLPELRSVLPTIGAWVLALLAISLFFEFQPYMIAAMFGAADAKAIGGSTSGGLIADIVASLVQWLAAVTAPIAAIVTLARKQLAEMIKQGSAGSRWSSLLAGLVAQAAMWVAAAALPLVIWVGYLYLCYWAIPNDLPPTAECVEQTVSGDLSLNLEVGDSSRAFSGVVSIPSENPCPENVGDNAGQDRGAFGHQPGWLSMIDSTVGEWALRRPPWTPPPASEAATRPVPFPWPLIVTYLIGGLLIFAVSLLLKPNANSLHRLYRDRLSKAFLFHPKTKADLQRGMIIGKEFEPLDLFVSELANLHTPYHLINAALNVQGSDFSNRRGRNADFFVFSPHFVGSEATGYVRTKLYETDPPDLDLGAALAISGAAFSSNMGAKSIRALTPTLALLNVRLGYWLKNPSYLRHLRNVQRKARQAKVIGGGVPLENSEGSRDLRLSSGVFPERKPRIGRDPRLAPLYLWAEITGRLHENSKVIYVTDGGHIENLGVYELLRRRCRLIVVVDADADPDMRYPSFVTMQRYARIDLGVRFDMPFEAVQKTTVGWMGVGSAAKPNAPDGLNAANGPHIAVGRIDYGNGSKGSGYIVYVKASLTGDENDYVRDYARRHPTFPHETTGDQFFSEEQFEVYRALGFHAMFGFLSGEAKVAVAEALRAPKRTEQSKPKAATEGDAPLDAAHDVSGDPSLIRADDLTLAAIREMLGLSASSSQPPANKAPA